MPGKNFKAMRWLAVPAICLAGLWTAAGLFAGPPAAGEAGSPAGRLRAAGKEASMTVLPVSLGGRPVKQVGEVVGMLLEGGGMANLDASEDAFQPPAHSEADAISKALSEYVKAHPPTTDYVLYAEFLASPQRQFTEVRAWIVDRDGNVAWQDRQTRDDADFKRVAPKEPLQCCVLLTERLRPLLNLGDTTMEPPAEGRLARKWRIRTGTPDKAETDAMELRQKQFRQSASNSKLIVYPARAGDEFSASSADRLASQISKNGYANATAVHEGPQIKVNRDMNEQKTLWAMARAFREEVKKQPPDADYTLFADYLMGDGHVGAVHFAICDRQGELVLVDFQNSHHKDFNAVDPKSREDCDKLVLRRLKGYCR